MATSPTVRAVIGEQIVELRFSGRVDYRVGTLDRPLALTDINKPRRAKAAASQWIWGCLTKESQQLFDSPDDIAEAMKDGQWVEAIGALVEAYNVATNPSAKNADSSTPSPSPASS